MKTANDDEWLSVPQAAELRGIHRNNILRAIADERLPAQRIGGRWILRKSDVLAWKRVPAGRPKKGPIDSSNRFAEAFCP